MDQLDPKLWLRLAATLLSALFCLAPFFLLAQDKLPQVLPLRTVTSYQVNKHLFFRGIVEHNSF